MNQNEIICILCNYFTDLATIICINILRFSRCFYHINISKISVDWQSRGHGFEPRYLHHRMREGTKCTFSHSIMQTKRR